MLNYVDILSSDKNNKWHVFLSIYNHNQMFSNIEVEFVEKCSTVYTCVIKKMFSSCDTAVCDLQLIRFGVINDLTWNNCHLVWDALVAKRWGIACAFCQLCYWNTNKIYPCWQNAILGGSSFLWSQFMYKGRVTDSYNAASPRLVGDRAHFQPTTQSL